MSKSARQLNWNTSWAKYAQNAEQAPDRCHNCVVRMKFCGFGYSDRDVHMNKMIRKIQNSSQQDM